MGLLLLSLLVLFAAVVALSIAIPVARLVSVRLRGARGVSAVAVDAVPAEVLASLRRHGEQVEALGLTLAGALREDDPIDGVAEPAWSLVYASPGGEVLARLGLSDTPTRAQPVELAFLSFGSFATPSGGGPVLFETVAWRRHRLAPDVPGHRLVDAETLDASEQLGAHRRQLEDAGPGLVLDAPAFAELPSRIGSFRRRERASELEARHLVARRDGTHRHSLRGALARVLRANRGEPARLRALAGADPGATPTTRAAAVDVTPALAAHRRREAVEASRHERGRLRKACLFVGSGLLFLALFGLRFSMETVLLLVAALVLHELGHALAMRAFGYRDLQIVFVPFLGAVATGRKDEAVPWQEVVVLLAGPLPGIVLGTWLMTSGLADADPLAYAFANILLVLNYVNLLPVHPLDGGKILSIVVFDRLPTLQIGFNAISSVAIVAGGLWVGEVAIACVGGALLLGVPGQLRQVRTFVRLRRALGRTGRAAADPLRTIYLELQDRRFDRWNGEVRYQFVKRVRERLRRRLASRPVVAVGLAVYVAAWVVPVDALLEHHVARSTAASAEEATQAGLAVEHRGDVAWLAPEPAPRSWTGLVDLGPPAPLLDAVGEAVRPR